jgi:hypothetical protein
MQKPEWVHTLRLMFLALAILFGGVAAFASAWGRTMTWPHETPAERYLALGSGTGTVSLVRDMENRFPPGSDLHGALQRLSQMGFDCRPEGDRGQSYNCALQVQRGNARHPTRLELRVVADGRNLRMIAPPDRG